MPSINLTIPLYNEQTVLAENVAKILNFIHNLPAELDEIASVASLSRNDQYEWRIILADNDSTDNTPMIAKSLEKKYHKKVDYLRLDKKGKGLAIKTAWQKFPADYYIFMDADLSTDLSTLPRLIEELKNGAGIVIGSRYLPNSQTNRSLLRLFVSKISLWFISKWLKLPLTDFTCGFKGVNQKIVQNILPLIKNQQWFFDTEMLCHTKRAGYTIKEIPVIWTETLNQKRKSKVGLIKVGWEYLKEVIKNRPV
ncbi:MAG: glycosyltransferase [Patescibacteria group bacterium]